MRLNTTLRKYLLLLVLMLTITIGKSAHFYVDSSATAGANNGLSWANAYRNLQTAINAVPATDTLWVADGHYFPGLAGDNTAWFDLKIGQVILGGFQGASGAQETSASQRNWFNNVTVLSGDLDHSGGHSVGDAYHVLNSAGKDTLTVVDGFVVEWGYANGPGPHTLGGAVFAFGGGGTYANCIFQNHYASDRGGAVYASGNFNFRSCLFRNNQSVTVGGGLAHSGTNFKLRVMSCVFTNNMASQGASIYAEANDGGIYNSTFLNNVGGFASCVLTINNTLAVRNCIMWGNTGIPIQGSVPIVSRCIIQGGYAPGTNILNVDPEFLDGLGRIGACSPAAEAGDSLLSIVKDFNGNPRPFDSDGNLIAKWDLGAFEVQSLKIFPATNSIVGANPACAHSFNNLYRVGVDNTPVSTYQWSLSGGGTISGTTTNDSVRVNWGSTLGSYTLTVKEINAASGCSTTNTALISLNPPPTVTLNPAPFDSICTGDSLLVTVSGSGLSQQWYKNGVAIPGATATTIRAKQTGYYNAVMTGANGCSDSASASLRLYLRPLPIVTFTTSVPIPICQGQTVTITGSPGVSHQWFRNGGLLSGATANTYATGLAGIYNMRQTDSHGCRDSAAVGLQLTVNPLPIVTVSPAVTDTICIGDSLALTATAANAVSYQWFRNHVAIPSSNVNPFQAKLTGVYNCRLTNNNGCTDSAAVGNRLTVNDFINPVAVCRNVTLHLNGSGSASLTPAQADNGSSDNCRIASFGLSTSAFTCSQLGSNAVTLTVTDPAARTATCVSTVTVLDTIKPIVVCSPATVYIGPSGTLTLNPTAVGGASSDNCAITLATVTPASFICADTGAHSVTYHAQDASGNFRNCTTSIVLEDSTRPVALCRTATIFLDGGGNASITAASVNNSSTDNCGIASVGVSRTNFNCADVPGVFVTLSLQDVSGNLATCQAYVRVVDSVSPVVHCRDTTIYIDFTGLSTLTPAMLNNNSTDNCVIDSLWISQSTFTCANTGVNNVNFFAADADTNTASCIAQVTIMDTIAPHAACTDTTFYLNASGIATVNPAVFGLHSVDNCTYFDTSYVDVGTYNCAQTGMHTVMLYVVDVSGRVDSCSGNVTILDNLAPLAHCNNIAPILNPGGNVSITVGQVNNASTDNCSIASLSLSQTAFTCAHVGPNNIILTVTDIFGNVGTCTSVVTVTDTVAPVALCHNVTTYLNGAGTTSVTPAQVNNGSSDNCSSVSLALSTTTFGCAQAGSNAVTLTVTDTYGNVHNCGATVTVIDSIRPVAACQNVTAYLNTSGQFTLTPALVDNGGTDNCSIATRTLSQTNFTCAHIGANAVVLTLTDPSGLTRICNSTVTILDTIRPVAVCVNGSFSLTVAGTLTLTVANVASGSTDNCSISSSSVTPSTFSCGTLGPQTVTANFADASGNASSCTATVTIQDLTAPNAVCLNATLVLSAAGTASLNTVAINGGSTDACGISSVTASMNAFACADIGANNVTLSATDGSGNVGTCTAVVTVEDTIHPVISCTTATVFLSANGTYSLAGSLLSVGSMDICTIDTSYAAPYLFDCADIGVNAVQVYVADPSGNLDSCTTSITLLDNLAPLADCDSVQLQLGSNGLAILTPVILGPNSSDNCGIDSSTVSQTTFDCSSTGWVAVTLTLWDSTGNQSSCVGHAMVIDTSGVSAASVSLGPDTTACNGAVLSFSGPAGMSSYVWSTGANTQSITVTTAGTYWVQVVSPQGCAGSDTVVVTSFVTPNPHLRSESGNPVVCINDTLRLLVDPGFVGYLWSTGSTISYTDVTTGGNYTVSVTDANGCVLLQTIAIQFSPFPGPRPVILPGDSVAMCENTTVQLDAGAGYYTYLWSTGQTSQVITAFVPGLYHVDVWNGFGCHGTSSPVAVFTTSSPYPDIQRTGNNLFTNAVAVSYQWYLGTVPILGATGPSYIATLNGSYRVRAYYANGCNEISTALTFIVGVADELELLEGIQVYPNPSNGLFQLQASAPIRKALSIEVTDLFGRKLYRQSLKQLHDVYALDLTELSAGMYLLEIKTAEANIVRRIVIE